MLLRVSCWNHGRIMHINEDLQGGSKTPVLQCTFYYLSDFSHMQCCELQRALDSERGADVDDGDDVMMMIKEHP
jgi:hypothetical protein